MSEPKPTKEPIQQRAAQDSQANQQKNEQSKDNQAMDDASRAKSPLEEVQGLQARIAKSLLEDIQELQARIAKKAMDDATRAELLSKEVERLQERITKRNDNMIELFRDGRITEAEINYLLKDDYKEDGDDSYHDFDELCGIAVRVLQARKTS